jgi:hypothetical protein
VWPLEGVGCCGLMGFRVAGQTFSPVALMWSGGRDVCSTSSGGEVPANYNLIRKKNKRCIELVFCITDIIVLGIKDYWFEFLIS